ncbi:MAG: ImmA/IrrE family metallo-endopeptidase [Chloroflexi bacterium]|nr:ImmA/IrrE family metallo-endopeptidase [Chloroflexota bacterium]
MPPSSSPATPSALDVAGLAAGLLTRHRAAVPVDPARLAAAEGLRVETRPLPRGAGERLEDGALVVNAGLSPQWQRWAAARGLGRYLLGQDASARLRDADLEEFAGYLLMPEGSLGDTENPDYDLLSDRFDVPFEVVPFRLDRWACG